MNRGVLPTNMADSALKQHVTDPTKKYDLKSEAIMGVVSTAFSAGVGAGSTKIFDKVGLGKSASEAFHVGQEAVDRALDTGTRTKGQARMLEAAYADRSFGAGFGVVKDSIDKAVSTVVTPTTGEPDAKTK